MLDVREFAQRNPRLAVAFVILKKSRAKVAFALVVLVVISALFRDDHPIDPTRWSVLAMTGWLLILLGTAFRIAALGAIRKKEELATTGVYSLCRHPLYLGSILIGFGFAVFMNHWAYYLIASLYFLIFYSLVIVWEESRLAERYGDEHKVFAQSTPLLLPIGRFKHSQINLRAAMSSGGRLVLCLGCCVLLVEILVHRP